MIIKILGILDILAGLLFAVNNNIDKINLLPNKIILILGVILLIKGIIFLIFLDFASIADIICGTIIIISFWIPINIILTLIVALFLIQKGIISLAS